MSDGELRFEAYQEADASGLVEWLTSEVWPFHGSSRPTADKVRSWIEEGSFTGEENRTLWIHTADEERVGLLVLHELTDLTPVFDLRLKSSARGRGLGGAALAWLACYVFTECDKHRLEGHTRVDNVAMRRTFRACGWVKEAHYRQAWPDDQGRYHDAVTYAILRDDWKRGTSTPVDWDSEY